MRHFKLQKRVFTGMGLTLQPKPENYFHFSQVKKVREGTNNIRRVW